MKKILPIIICVLIAASCSKTAPTLSTEYFNFTDEVKEYLKPLGDKTKVASLEKEIVLVSSKDFSITNFYVLPFLHYQLSYNGVDASSLETDRIKDFMNVYAFIFAKNEAISREAQESGITITDEEIEELINKNTQGRLDDFKEFIATTALSWDFYLKDTKQSLYINKYEESILKDIVITEAEKKDYFLNDPTISKTNPKLEVRSIVINFKPGIQQDKAKEKITKIRNDIVNSNKDFAEMAKKHSDDESTKNAGGKMGDFVTRGSLQQEVEMAAFSLPIGQVSEIIELDNAYEIIKVESVSGESDVEYDDISDTIENILTYKKQEKIVNEDTERIISKYGLKYHKI